VTSIDTPDHASAIVADVRFEHARDAFGIGEARPRLSWRLETSAQGWRQSAYAIEAYGADGTLRDETGWLELDESVLVPWPFAPLTSRERVTVQVRVRGEDGLPSSWSEPATAEAGLLQASDWSASFLTPDWEEDTSKPQPAPLLRPGRSKALHQRPGSLSG
jgi:alpha-L-rhamnosidase